MTTCLTAQKTQTCTQGILFLDEKKRSVEIESDHHDEDFIRGVEPSVELLDDAAVFVAAAGKANGPIKLV